MDSSSCEKTIVAFTAQIPESRNFLSPKAPQSLTMAILCLLEIQLSEQYFRA